MTPPENGTPAPPARSHRQWQALAEARVKAGDRSDVLVTQLVTEGLVPHEAQALVDAARARQRKSAGIIIGCHGAVLLAGVVATIASLAAADPDFVVYFGAIIVGLGGLIYGCARLAKVG